MSLIAYLIVLFITGLIVGALARLFLPGRDPMGIFETAAVGIGGSVIAGLIALAIFHRRGGGGIILSIICAMGLVWLIRRSRERRAGPRRGGFVGRR
ncbi:MAG: GlsB/YeaQ/YmgE family stress response membrane protein [Solirubrobacteraceae bacterium]